MPIVTAIPTLVSMLISRDLALMAAYIVGVAADVGALTLEAFGLLGKVMLILFAGTLILYCAQAWPKRWSYADLSSETLICQEKLLDESPANLVHAVQAQACGSPQIRVEDSHVMLPTGSIQYFCTHGSSELKIAG